MGEKAHHRLDEGEAADVISGEQAVGGGLLQGDPHDPRFETSDMGCDLCPSTLGPNPNPDPNPDPGPWP